MKKKKEEPEEEHLFYSKSMLNLSKQRSEIYPICIWHTARN